MVVTKEHGGLSAMSVALAIVGAVFALGLVAGIALATLWGR